MDPAGRHAGRPNVLLRASAQQWRLIAVLHPPLSV